MKKFVFELQTLQDIKKKHEDAEKKLLHKIEEKIKELNIKLKTLDNEIRDTKSELSREIGRAIKAHNLNDYNNYLKQMAQLAEMQKEKIANESAKKNECVDRLIEIQKELKSLEKLREKKYEEYLKEAKKEEEKIIDDIVSFKIAAS